LYAFDITSGIRAATDEGSFQLFQFFMIYPYSLLQHNVSEDGVSKGRSLWSSFFFFWGHRGIFFFLSKKKKKIPL